MFSSKAHSAARCNNLGVCRCLVEESAAVLLLWLLVVLIDTQARGSSGKPLLECAYRQAVVLVKELKASNLPAALVLDVPGLCSGTSSSS